MKRMVFATAMCAAFAGPRLQGQSACTGRALAGTVEDTTSAVIPGAHLTLDGTAVRDSGADGTFRIGCVKAGRHHLVVNASGFAPLAMDVPAGRSDGLKAVLIPSDSIEINVSGDAPVAGPVGGLSGSTIAGTQLQTLADDPDDLKRELQQMAAAAGGSPAATTISVDGFQGDSALPPKSSIAYVRVNPDLFSAEYREPPFGGGGRVEIYTKPGAKAYHGAVFTTYSGQFLNARDPFSVSSAAIGKQRYGFEFTGPVRRQGSNFTMTLEHRSIDNFAVVNAITLGANGNQGNTVSNVATPQRLWEGTSRVDWQLGPKNIAFVSYSANVNHLGNVGVGGTSLADTGYDSGAYQHTIRLSNVTTASPNLVHEARVSLEWRGETDVPVSGLPQVQVSGAFTSGGADIGQQRIGEFRTEWDDDVILTRGKQNIKAGLQFQSFREHQTLPTNFNGTYIFGGGTAPVLDANGNPTAQTETITGLQQYQRSVRAQAGGTPTEFSGVAGNPQVDFTQARVGLFVQDDWKVKPSVNFSFGLRYFLQTDPTTNNALTPRFGVDWVPDRKKTWDLNAHVGLFSGQASLTDYAELVRQDGVQRVTSLVYNPVYNPMGSPAGSYTTIHSERSLSSSFNGTPFGLASLGVSKTFPHGWNLNGSFIGLRIWDEPRSVNINTPLNGSPTGPRPGTPNLNNLQIQTSGHGLGDAEFVGLSNQSLKHFQFYFGTVRINLRDDGDDNTLFSPQSAYTDAGEFSRRTGNGLWQTFGNASLKLPGKVQVSADYYGTGDRAFNITTGFDNNGDGNFNDRPQFALPGQAGAVPTPFGTLVASGGTGTLRRNLGNLPWSFNLDTNVQRSFAMSHDRKAEHQQTLTANVRSSNVLNHTNVTAEGGVLGSPFFLVPYAADNGRRIEGGLRYSF